MKQYFNNVWLWLRGFKWLWTRDLKNYDGTDTPVESNWIYYKTGWGAKKFLPLYLLDYGISCVVFGNGVVSLSRAWKLLGKDHWSHTGMWLWGTSKCSRKVRTAVILTWVVLILVAWRPGG